MTHEEAMAKIKQNLKKRSGKSWSVTGGRGTSWGWIHITAPPARRTEFGTITKDEGRELMQLLGLDHPVYDCETVPASPAYWAEYVDRSAGIQPRVTGTQYWD